VHEHLKSFEWKRRSGRGSRGEMMAIVPGTHALVKLLDEIPESLWRSNFGGIYLIVTSACWPNTGKEVRCDKAALERLGVKFKRRKATPKDKEYLQVLDKANMTPKELENMLAAKGRLQK